MDSHDDPGINIYRFIIAVLLISINIYGKSIKNYSKLKSFYFFINLEDEKVDLIFIFFFIFCSPDFADSKSTIKNHLSFKETEIFYF